MLPKQGTRSIIDYNAYTEETSALINYIKTVKYAELATNHRLVMAEMEVVTETEVETRMFQSMYYCTHSETIPV